MKAFDRATLLVSAMFACSLFTSPPLFANAAAPASQPTPAATQPDISPEARAQLAALRAAYSNLHAIQFTGTLSGNLTAGGKQQPLHYPFDTTFLSPSQFRHTPKAGADGSANISFGGTGAFAYMLLTGPKGSGYLSESPAVAADQIADHRGQLATAMWRLDPALALCIAPGSGVSLAPDARRIHTAPDVLIDGHPFSAVIYDCPASQVVLLLDQKTHLVRRISTTIPPRPGATGVAAVAGVIVCDYPSTTLNAAPLHQSFDWTPPPGAQQLLQPAEVADKFQGRPAPDLTFTCLDGTRVTLSALKGHVVVLDFWATWCVPCIASMPALHKLHEENQSKGLEMFALDAGEKPDAVKDFIANKQMTLPVAIDDGTAAKAYAADALPETVVIGKDGRVEQVFVGFSADSETRLRTAIQHALAQP
ncbi:MAG TPA: TlpA disulfide reductase family protein [Phycisphaerae bacterium]|nr:TlpA disulfide reductase family protein [Phycisphaerae bacterium]